MKKTRKKLALNKQTLRRLTVDDLRRPAAAAIHFTDQICSSDGVWQCEPLFTQWSGCPSGCPGCTE
jgi:hypothetical protein